jgi:translation elongation factor IF5A
MVLKIISATDAKVGTSIMIEGESFIVKKVDISKTGKHGSHKCRIEAAGVINPAKRKIFVASGGDKFDVPNILKRKGQVLSINGEKVSLMDLETFETIEIECKDPEVIGSLIENENAEYWDVEGEKMIKRKI